MQTPNHAAGDEGLLPEADPRDRIASILGISGGNDFAMLERIGGECAGAVSLLPEEMPAPATAAGRLRWLDEDDLAEIVERLPQQPLMAGEEGLRLSLAGDWKNTVSHRETL